jgi:hypothetical protein
VYYDIDGFASRGMQEDLLADVQHWEDVCFEDVLPILISCHPPSKRRTLIAELPAAFTERIVRPRAASDINSFRLLLLLIESASYYEDEFEQKDEHVINIGECLLSAFAARDGLGYLNWFAGTAVGELPPFLLVLTAEVLAKILGKNVRIDKFMYWVPIIQEVARYMVGRNSDDGMEFGDDEFNLERFLSYDDRTMQCFEIVGDGLAINCVSIQDEVQGHPVYDENGLVKLDTRCFWNFLSLFRGDIELS